MISRLIRSLTRFNCTVLGLGCIMLAVMISDGSFPNLLLPAHDFDDVMDNGLKTGAHIKGELPYSYGGFATKESYTQNKTSRTAAKTTGYYYLIPAGDEGIAAVYVHKDKFDSMEDLTEETYDFVTGGQEPQGTVHFEGTALKMDKELQGLEKAFRSELKDMGYSEAEITEMLSAYTDGECLVISGPRDISTFYVMTAIAFAAIIAGILLIVRGYKKEKAYDEQRTGM